MVLFFFCLLTFPPDTWGQWISAKALALTARSPFKKAVKADQIMASLPLRDVAWRRVNKRWSALTQAQQWNELVALFDVEWQQRVPTHLADATSSIRDITKILTVCPVCRENKALKLCSGCGVIRVCGTACFKSIWREHR